MTELSRYNKCLPKEGYNPKRQVTDSQPFILQITLGKMALEDAFHTALAPYLVDCSWGEIINQVFPDHPTAIPRLPHLDVENNPDLPEIYETLVDMFRLWRRGGCELRFFVNRGPEIPPESVVSKHVFLSQQPPQLLDIVIEQRYTSLDYAVAKGYWPEKHTLNKWMQGQILLNMLAHSGPLPQDKIEGQEMHTILLNLEGQRFVEQTQIGDRWAVTADGQHQLESLLREAESYHTRYDIFKDVFYERGTPVEFESEIGKDLRADVIESEGLDPVRVLFVQLLMGGSVQRAMKGMQKGWLSDNFLDDFLAPAVPMSGLDAIEIEKIIEDGLIVLEERAEEAQRRTEEKEMVARSKYSQVLSPKHPDMRSRDTALN